MLPGKVTVIGTEGLRDSKEHRGVPPLPSCEIGHAQLQQEGLNQKDRLTLGRNSPPLIVLALAYAHRRPSIIDLCVSHLTSESFWVNASVAHRVI
jgi:hypothetical protein